LQGHTAARNKVALCCPFNRGHDNLRGEGFAKHMKKCKDRERVTGPKGIGKSRWKSQVFRSTMHRGVELEVCYYMKAAHNIPVSQPVVVVRGS
jgi:hypothetical protein